MQIHDLALAGHSDKMVLAKLSIKCWFNRAKLGQNLFCPPREVNRNH